MIFSITGKIKPYVRTRRGAREKYAREYLDWKRALQLLMRNGMSNAGYDMFPEKQTLVVTMRIAHTNHKCDLDNQIKAILDSCNDTVFPDDRWVDEIYADRSDYDRTELIVDVTRVVPRSEIIYIDMEER